VSIDTSNPWEERYDESSQALYYFNKMTGESVWEKPKDYDELSEYGVRDRFVLFVLLG
jgi:hypothetical protein